MSIASPLNEDRQSDVAQRFSAAKTHAGFPTADEKTTVGVGIGIVYRRS
jgi:hypothetical protein